MVDKDFDEDLADNGALSVRSIVLGGQAHSEDTINNLTVVLPIKRAVRGQGNVRLEMMKEQWKRGNISSEELGLGVTIVAVVLGDGVGHVAEDEGRQVKSKDAGFESTDNDSEQLGSVGKEVLVVAGDACPPRI